ncbi:hypothetical protein [Lysinibacillus sp. LZ02]
MLTNEIKQLLIKKLTQAVDPASIPNIHRKNGRKLSCHRGGVFSIALLN